MLAIEQWLRFGINGTRAQWREEDPCIPRLPAALFSTQSRTMIIRNRRVAT